MPGQTAESMRAYRAKNNGARERNREMSAAYNAALGRLAGRYPEEFKRLYELEKKRRGLKPMQLGRPMRQPK